MKAEQSKPNESKGLKMAFRALRHRNFRLFFFGQSISLIGTWMQQIAISWLVYRLTNSVLLLGVVAFIGQIPSFIFAPITGALIDRWNRHRLIIVTQTLSMLQALLLAFLVFMGIAEVWHIILLSIALGIINVFDMPARQAFVVEMIETREDLGNAIVLNSTLFNGARLIGPSIAGILIAVVGEGTVFLINGLSFLTIIAALLAMKIIPKKIETGNTNVLTVLKEGFSYAFGFAPIRFILLLLGLASLMGMSYQILMPVFAKDIFHGGPDTLGFLLAASGGGALLGAAYLASIKSTFKLGKMIPLATSIAGIGLAAFSLSGSLSISLPFIFTTGFGFMVQTTSSNTTLQTIVEDDKRGRVMAFFTMALVGMAPFGSLIMGSLADAIGAPNTLLIGGISCIIGSLLFVRKLPALKEMVHPIYKKN